MGKKYSQIYLRKCLNKLKKDKGRFNLSMRYYRDTKEKEVHNHMKKVFKQFREKTVLDVGCHIGYYGTVISSFADRVIGIDIDKKILDKANHFKKITGAQNIDFELISAFDLDDKFMEENGIDAVFIHKSVGDLESNTHWSTEDFEKVFSLFKKHCDILICNDIKRVKKFFQKDGFPVQEFPSYRRNSLYVIKRPK